MPGFYGDVNPQAWEVHILGPKFAAIAMRSMAQNVASRELGARGRRDARFGWGRSVARPLRGHMGALSRPSAWDIPVYTNDMKVVKVRRVGNSNVVSIPREFEARGYAAGTSVLVEELEGGELRLIPTEQVRDRIRGVGKRVVDEHAEALQILAEHDPDDESPKR